MDSLTAAERELRRFKAYIRKHHNFYDPEFRKAVPDAKIPKSEYDAMRDLVEERNELLESEVRLFLTDRASAAEREDGDEPVTEEWLTENKILHNTIGNNEPRRVWHIIFDFPQVKEPSRNRIAIPAELLPTRWHVRRLCAALGVTLREPGRGE